MSIEVNNETTAKIDAREFVDLARYVFDAMFLHPATELSITFVDESAMSDLHEEWMDLEGPTDVMSFPMDELREGSEGDLAPEGLLGDIVICPSVAASREPGAHCGAQHRRRDAPFAHARHPSPAWLRPC